jgi:hypothetical protein
MTNSFLIFLTAFAIIFKLLFSLTIAFYFPALIAYFYRKCNAKPWSFLLEENEKKWLLNDSQK